MDQQEINANLNEPQFTKLCKMGYLVESSPSGTHYLNFTNADIKSLISGDVVKKFIDDKTIIFSISKIDGETVSEIVKRSPIYYELINQ